MRTKEKKEIEAIVEKAKSEIREGVSGRKMTMTDVSMKMTETLKEIQMSFMGEVEELIIEEHYTGETNCKDCGRALKKTEKRNKKKE